MVITKNLKQLGGRSSAQKQKAARAKLLVLLAIVIMLVFLTKQTQTPLNSYLPSRSPAYIYRKQQYILFCVTLTQLQILIICIHIFSATAKGYIHLPTPHSNFPAISTGACCGIGHRITFNIASMVYAISNYQLVNVNWTDIEWNALFYDTPQIKQGPRQEEHYDNGYPEEWRNSPLAKTGPRQQPINASSYDQYGESHKEIFDMPLAQSILKSLSNNLSSRVLSFLDPMRNQYASKQHRSGGLHLCAHIREGNNETGDWKGKEWRHIDLHGILNSTLAGMKDYVFSTTGNGNESATYKMNRFKKPKVSVFVASDNKIARPWFESHVPNNWHVIKPGKYLPRPETGVWFGEWGSETNKNLTKDQKDEAMAEAVADVFALGECDSLFIPNYSSFSATGITLTRAKKKNVFFLGKGGRYLEMPEIRN